MNAPTSLEKKNELGLGLPVAIFALVLGLALRVVFTDAMEFKNDEHFHFAQAMAIAHGGDWSWVGMPSGVHILNPGMSVWVFAALAKISNAHSPIELARALAVLSWFGVLGLLPLALWVVDQTSRRFWIWATAFAAVNPFALLYQRKLWPEPFFALLTPLALWGWFRRDRIWGSLLWGFVGAILGQVHLSGFFFSAAVVIWTLVFNRQGRPVRWSAWGLGSLLGALPLLPWLKAILGASAARPPISGFDEIVQLKYWVFWFSDALGIHLGNALGIHRGGNFAQISDFIRYPVVGDHATYLVLVAHIGVVLIAGLLFLPPLFRRTLSLLGVIRDRRGLETSNVIENISSYLGRERGGNASETQILYRSALYGMGALLTLTGARVRRYYLCVTTPLEFVWLTRWTFRRFTDPRVAEKVLFSLWICQAFISACFVGYVHINNGAVDGDYGVAYRAQSGIPQLLEKSSDE